MPPCDTPVDPGPCFASPPPSLAPERLFAAASIADIHQGKDRNMAPVSLFDITELAVNHAFLPETATMALGSHPMATKAAALADDLRERIQRGALRPGDKLPGSPELAAETGVSSSTVRAAYGLLVSEGLLVSLPGDGTYVRPPAARVVRDGARYVAEKLRAGGNDDDELAETIAEMDAGVDRADVEIEATYDQIDPSDDLAEALGVGTHAPVLERSYVTTAGDEVVSIATSWIPVGLLDGVPELLSADCEPYPGGTIKQLQAVGVEVDRIVDEVEGGIATAATAQMLGITAGEAVIHIAKRSYDTTGRVVELAHIQYAARRTTLRYAIDLPRWE